MNPYRSEPDPSNGRRTRCCTILEAIYVGLEYQVRRLWLLLGPTLTVTTDGTWPDADKDRSEIGREDLATRYNKKANALLEFWIILLAARCGRPIRLSFPEASGSDAVVETGTVRAFSRET